MFVPGCYSISGLQYARRTVAARKFAMRGVLLLDADAKKVYKSVPSKSRLVEGNKEDVAACPFSSDLSEGCLGL